MHPLSHRKRSSGVEKWTSVRPCTTASPVSGADVRERMQFLALRSEFLRAVHVIRTALQNLSTVGRCRLTPSNPH